MINHPLISVITVNYNQSQATCEMLDSLLATGYPALEVIVVDNNSTKDNPEQIIKRFPNIIFIQSSKNLGFAGGNNLAIKQAKGDYIYLLNNDTVVPERNIENLLSVFQNNVLVGVVCPKIKFFSHPELVQFAGYTELSKYTFRNKCIGYGEPDSDLYNIERHSAYAHGAAMMLKREVIQKVGLMNEHYFLYYEELDWSTRIKKAGYDIIYTPSTYILHKESLSTGKNSPLQTYYLNRNRVLYVRCNVSGHAKFFGVMYQMFIAMPKNILLCALRGQLKSLKSILKAWWWNAKNITNHSACSYDIL